MTKEIDYDEEIRQRFAMLHMAWDAAYGSRKRNPTYELRKYLHILAGVNAIWDGISRSKHYYRVSPIYQLDSGLTVGICRCICDILINTHPDYRIPESLAGEMTEVVIELLERHICADAYPDQTIIKSFENVIHVLALKTVAGEEVAKENYERYKLGVDDLDGSVFQDLVDILGPTLAYVEYVSDEDYDAMPDYWGNDLYRGKRISDFEHMSCDLCWGPNSPEVIANREIKEREERKKLRAQPPLR
jgi:hypothetical protein